MNDHVGRALARVLRDLESTGVPVPRVEPSDWQTHEPSESARLRSAGGSGMGVWVDPSLAEAEQVAMVADQVQELVVEEMPRCHLPTNWPPCPEHPDSHPLTATVRGDVAVWVCPRGRRGRRAISATCPVGTGGTTRRRFRGQTARRGSPVARDSAEARGLVTNRRFRA